VSTGGSKGEEILTEHVSLNFAKVKVEYTEQTEKGLAGSKPKMGWDIEANKKL
jgi:type VI secretion system secreted protein Hcp